MTVVMEGDQELVGHLLEKALASDFYKSQIEKSQCSRFKKFVADILKSVITEVKIVLCYVSRTTSIVP